MDSKAALYSSRDVAASGTGREEGIPLCPTLWTFGEEKQWLLLLGLLSAEPRVLCQLLPWLSPSSHPHSCHLSLAELLSDSSTSTAPLQRENGISMPWPAPSWPGLTQTLPRGLHPSAAADKSHHKIPVDPTDGSSCFLCVYIILK